jgi:hypothetical protein
MDERGEMVPVDDVPAGIEEKALAYALWGPMTIRNKAYFNYSNGRRIGYNSGGP